jgi:hypothetical protein
MKAKKSTCMWVEVGTILTSVDKRRAKSYGAKNKNHGTKK